MSVSESPYVDRIVCQNGCLTEMLLMEAGDVEPNPGPFESSSDELTENELITLADEIPFNRYHKLCNILGTSFSLSQAILNEHLWDYPMALLEVLCRWKDKRGDGGYCRNVLAEALRDVGLGILGEKLSGGGYLRKEFTASGAASSRKRKRHVITDYKMTAQPRGIALIISNEDFLKSSERTGTEIDRSSLETLFKGLGFKVISHKDLRVSEIVARIESVSKEDHSAFDCFICAILTHGTEGKVCGTDDNNEPVQIDDIIQHFNSDRCKTLLGKPKLFFFQSCRGVKRDEGAEVDSISSDGDADDSMELKTDLDFNSSISPRRKKIPIQSDMLIAYATVPGYVSWRNPEKGSWFIQTLVDVFTEHAREEDLLSMLTLVNSEVARAYETSSEGHKQMPAPETMLTKRLFFFPDCDVKRLK